MVYLRVNEILKEKNKTKYWFVKYGRWVSILVKFIK